jgi:two-component system, NtrC family, sensor kinase
MSKYYKSIVISLLLFSCKAEAQTFFGNEHSQVMSMVRKCALYSKINFDSAKYFGSVAQKLSKQIDFLEGEINALCFLGVAYTRGGDFPKALQLEFDGLQLARDNKLKHAEALCLYSIAKSYNFLNDFPTAISYGGRARHLFLDLGLEDSIKSKIIDRIDDVSIAQQFFDNDLVLGQSFMYSNQIDSALHYLVRLKQNIKGPFTNIVNIFLGRAYFQSGDRETGMTYLRSALHARVLAKDNYSTAWTCNFLADSFLEMNQPDSAIFYAKLGLNEAAKVGFKARVLYAAKQLAKLYANRDLGEANYYLRLSSGINEELFGSEKFFDLQKTLAEEQQQRQEAEKKQLANENTIRLYVLIVGISVIIFVTLVLYRNNRQKHTANLFLQEQNEKVKATLQELKSTQSQLIQSEKMASLGELTAGIAHEIQNPLNFVNNFSEVNTELIKEIQDERRKTQDQRDEKLENEILQDIVLNQQKINHHGKRAADIVKGMLQHSRSSSGVKEPTDINALADEYLRLAYHGLRAKDKSFNATMKTDFDETIGNINIIPQDIGRVILNLITNAFYVVNEKAHQNMAGYEPTVSVSTKKDGNKVLISVKDNGNGIPQKILDKIFQPFFTTKPTGQGTGLGLSLSYDIVKAHGGELRMETEEGEGSEFVIQLIQLPNN